MGGWCHAWFVAEHYGWLGGESASPPPPYLAAFWVALHTAGLAFPFYTTFLFLLSSLYSHTTHPLWFCGSLSHIAFFCLCVCWAPPIFLPWRLLDSFTHTFRSGHFGSCVLPPYHFFSLDLWNISLPHLGLGQVHLSSLPEHFHECVLYIPYMHGEKGEARQERQAFPPPPNPMHMAWHGCAFCTFLLIQKHSPICMVGGGRSTGKHALVWGGVSLCLLGGFFSWEGGREGEEGKRLSLSPNNGSGVVALMGG